MSFIKFNWYKPEFWYEKWSECFTTGSILQSCGSSSWYKLEDNVTKNKLSKRNVGFPGVWMEMVGLIGWAKQPGMFLHCASICNNQHQSWTCSESSSTVAEVRHNIWKSTFAMSSAKRWTAISWKLFLDANCNWLTWATARNTCLSHCTRVTIGLPIQRQGVPSGPLEEIMVDNLSSGEMAGLKQGMCWTCFSQSVDAWLV